MMYKELYILGIVVGIAGGIAMSCGIFMINNWQQIAGSGYTSPNKDLYSVNSLFIAIIFMGLVICCLGASLGAWAYGKRKDQQPVTK